MPALRDDQMFQVVAHVDVAPVVAMLDRLPWLGINGHIKGDPNRPPCSVVLWEKFPPDLKAFAEGIALGGRLGRAILRRLDPGQNIPPHTDAWMPGEMNWRRFQVPITSHSGIVMRWPDDGVSAYLGPGAVYEVRYDRTHEVVHGASVPRVHLQIDQIDATV